MTENVEALASHRQAIQRLIPILDAVRSIAEIAWRRAEERLTALREYGGHLDRVFQRVMTSLDQEARGALLGRQAGAPVALLLVSSERGLCGSFNRRLVEYGFDHARSLTAGGQTVRYLCLGTRGRRLVEAGGEKLLYARPLPSLSVPAYVDIEGVALDLLGLVEGGAFGRLLVIRNAPVRRFHYEPSVRALLPPEVAPGKGPGERVVVKPGGDVPGLLTHLLTEHLLVGLYQAVIESAMSEQLARVYTMRLATENARQLVDRLTFELNVAKHNAITSSLLEIVSGYAATARWTEPTGGRSPSTPGPVTRG